MRRTPAAARRLAVVATAAVVAMTGQLVWTASSHAAAPQPTLGGAASSAAGSASEDGARAARTSSSAPNPAANIPANPAFPSSCNSSTTSASCVTSVVQALDNARATVDHQHGTTPVGYALPADFAQLPTATQLLLLSNDDRAHVGRSLIVSLNATLNSVAQTAAVHDADPNGSVTVDGQPAYGWSANWAGGLPNALESYYLWMYDDGPGSLNIDCTTTDTSGCWGHRQDTLFNFGSSTVSMGVGAVIDRSGVTGGYAPSYTELYWATAKPVTEIPVVTGVSPASGAAGSTVTVTGLGLTGARTVEVGGSAATSVVVAANGQSLTAAVPAGSGTQSVTVVGSGGTSSAHPAAAFTYQQPVTPGAYVSIPPTRLLDTRGGHGPVAAQTSISLPVTGIAGIPTTATAVMLNVTATDVTAPGYVTAYGSGSVPTASNLNVSRGQTVADLALVPVAGGAVRLYFGGSGSTQLVVDVQGYVAASGATTAGAMAPVAPVRALDTRLGAGPLAAGHTLTFQAAGVGAVPASGASAVLLTLTATNVTGGEYLTAYADGAARPGTSNLNVSRGQTVPDLVLAPIGSDGKVAVYAGGTGSSAVIADIAGYVVGGDASASGATVQVAPYRLLDTRAGTGTLTSPPYSRATSGPSQDALPAGQMRQLVVTGRGGVPATGVTAVVLTLTAVGATGGQYLAAYADGGQPPAVSSLNVGPGLTVANLVVAPVGADGMVDIMSGGRGQLDVVADVSGYVLAGS